MRALLAKRAFHCGIKRNSHIVARHLGRKESGIGRTLDVVMLPWQLTSSLPRADLLLIDFSRPQKRGREPLCWLGRGPLMANQHSLRRRRTRVSIATTLGVRHIYVL